MLDLPSPDSNAQAVSTELSNRIKLAISDQGGSIGFDRFMHMALYSPGLGYYSAGSTKFGASGDFVTAPEVSELFGYCIANQISDLQAQGCEPSVFEFGAGSGKLCEQILNRISLQRYLILEPSAELCQRQQDYLRASLSPEQFRQIEWLDTLPDSFSGVVLANEVLDAMPVHLVVKQQQWYQRGICIQDDQLGWCDLAAEEAVIGALDKLESGLGDFATGYQTEINLNLAPWFNALAACCDRVAVFIIDYGYEQAEYYSQSRTGGTLVCHYQHRAHFDPLWYPGLQDITAFVDFDAAADAAIDSGFEAIGLVSQNRFLLGNGLLEAASQRMLSSDAREAMMLSQQLKTLSLPQEMGEKFKVMALKKNIELEMPAMSRSVIYG